jgi:hypothetical protein
VNGNYNKKGISATSGDGLSTVVNKWATPQAIDHNGGGANRYDDPNRSNNLNDQVLKWLTPTTTVMSRSEDGMQKRKEYRESIGRSYVPGNLEEQIAGTTGKKLNPDWVSQLMGLEVGTVRLSSGPHYVDEIRMLGNGVVPQQCAMAVLRKEETDKIIDSFASCEQMSLF